MTSYILDKLLLALVPKLVAIAMQNIKSCSL